MKSLVAVQSFEKIRGHVTMGSLSPPRLPNAASPVGMHDWQSRVKLSLLDGRVLRGFVSVDTKSFTAGEKEEVFVVCWMENVELR